MEESSILVAIENEVLYVFVTILLQSTLTLSKRLFILADDILTD
jgi:hypothetical protein